MAHPTDSPLATDPTPVVLPSDRDATGRDLGDRELELLAVAVRSGHLNSTGGTLVPRLAREFASRHGVPHAIACASGSAAVHAALGALGLRPGDEVVTTPLTDIGAVLPIAYEGATPVFADVDPVTLNVTADSLTAAITTRTRAVIVTHLFGQPCRMEPILALAQRHGFAVIEDAAQAFLATDGGRLCGTMGDLGCFSFQQGKHMTTGEGGIVVSSNKDLASGVQRFVDKGWGYGDPKPDHDRPGLNYRLTELQGAVGIAQLEKLDGCVQRRRASARALCEALADLEDLGVGLPIPAPGT
ncbi:MAG: DegT/DnrJ/EryC1/StrS family aminotransferase, partial [Planctomycetota bacterium]